MFKFGFSGQAEDESVEDSGQENIIPAMEIKWDASIKKLLRSSRFELEDFDIFYLDPSNILDVANVDSTIKEAEESHSDLIEGVYEGGLKIWECTSDVANYLCKENQGILPGKEVLDLGCGSGILGILAYKLGAAEVHFQDYNEGVIKYLTIPNNALNGDCLLAKSRFWCGDWKSFSEINNHRYDIILTSETIYNPKNHKKLLITFKTLLKPGGTIILGGKSYYFGVGGGLKQFLDLIKKDNILSYENVWKSETGVKREIILIRHKKSS